MQDGRHEEGIFFLICYACSSAAHVPKPQIGTLAVGLCHFGVDVCMLYHMSVDRAVMTSTVVLLISYQWCCIILLFTVFDRAISASAYCVAEFHTFGIVSYCFVLRLSVVQSWLAIWALPVA